MNYQLEEVEKEIIVRKRVVGQVTVTLTPGQVADITAALGISSYSDRTKAIAVQADHLQTPADVCTNTYDNILEVYQELRAKGAYDQ